MSPVTNEPTATTAELTDCVVPLDDEQQEALQEFWDRVIREEWTPAPTRTSVPDAMGELAERRSRRQARRAMAHIARATRPALAGVSPFGGEAA